MSDSKNIKFHPVPIESERLNIPVSIIKGSRNNKILGYSTLKDTLNKIVDTKNNELVNFTTSLLESRSNNANYSKLKNEGCNGFMIGKFTPPRNDNNCQIYVPLLGFDIDSLKDEFDCSLLLADCQNCPNIFLAFPSPSRKGLRIFIWCESTPKNHKKVYELVCQQLSESLRLKTDKAVRKELKAQGITNTKELNKLLKETEHIDTSTKNIGRIWFYTHLAKEDIYLNLDSEILKLSPTPSKRPERPQLHAPTVQPLDEAEKVRLCVKMAAQRNILAGRNNGLYSLACLMVEHGLGESAITRYCLTLDEIDFTESEIIKTVKSALNRATANKFSDAQLLQWRRKVEGTGEQKADKVPVEKKEIVKPKQEGTQKQQEKEEVLKNYKPLDLKNIIALEEHFADKNLSAFLKIKPYVLTKYDFRQNVISNDIEYRLKGTNDPFKELNEFDIECELLDYGVKSAVDKPLMTLLKSSLYVPRYNPIKDYFEELPEWDNSKPDHIINFANYVIAKDQKWFNYQFKKMLVRSVACALNHTPFNKQCFTFLGAQNDGKTSFFRFLCPPALKNYYKENIDITNKDGAISLTQNMFINFEELDALNKKELNKIKAMFTVDKIKVRPPYGRRELNFPRVCNFLASSNREEILTDETGNVRWLVFEIKGIKHDNGGKNGYNQNVDIDLVWAQAFHLLNTDFKFNLSREDLDKSEDNNKSYQEITAEMEWVQKLYSPSENDGSAKFVMSTDILNAIREKTSDSRITIRNIGKAMRFLGFTRSQKRKKDEKNPRYGYWVKLNSTIL